MRAREKKVTTHVECYTHDSCEMRALNSMFMSTAVLLIVSTNSTNCITQSKQIASNEMHTKAIINIIVPNSSEDRDKQHSLNYLFISRDHHEFVSKYSVRTMPSQLLQFISYLHNQTQPFHPKRNTIRLIAAVLYFVRKIVTQYVPVMCFFRRSRKCVFFASETYNSIGCSQTDCMHVRYARAFVHQENCLASLFFRVSVLSDSLKDV